MACPTCHKEIVLGEQEVWIRPDRKLAHVGCNDPVPPPPGPTKAQRRRQRKAARAAAETAAQTAATPAPEAVSDERPLALLWRSDRPFRWYVTTTENVEIFTATSATALGNWKREHPELRLVSAQEYVLGEALPNCDKVSDTPTEGAL